jgi:pyrroline-5-carboxylate reductase
MGVAVLSGVIDSLELPSSRILNGQGLEKWESHTPGTLTPTDAPSASIPSRFLACVSREETAVQLRKTFAALGPLGQSVEVLAGKNLEAVQEADVIILWYVLKSLNQNTLE